LTELTDTLVPELQQRGLFRSAYAGRTLREHLGLSRPASQYVGAPSEAHTAYDAN
jgi:alkanesulfonate monooxygenase